MLARGVDPLEQSRSFGTEDAPRNEVGPREPMQRASDGVHGIETSAQVPAKARGHGI